MSKTSVLLALSLITPYLATGAMAQTPPPVGDAVLTGLKACVANVQGNLPFNPPSAALTAAGIILADPVGTSDLAPFKSLTLQNRMFGAVASSTGQVTIGSDLTQGICRVAVEYAKPADITAVQASVRSVAGDWNPTSNGGGATSYSGTLFGASLMYEVRVPAPNTGYGSAGIIITVMNPAG